MKTVLFAITVISTAPAFADAPQATLGAPGCKVVNLTPLPKDSVKWSGACQDGYASGEGHLEWFVNGAFGSYYKGPLERGLPHGQGYLKRSDGTEYDGQFVHGQPEGQGVMLFPVGDRYDGQLKAGTPDGAGLMVYALGGRYEGQWRAGAFHGQGKAIYAGGQVREGQFGDNAPSEAPAKRQTTRYSLQSEGKWTTFFKSDFASSDDVPFDKSYAEMNAEQQNAVKRRYPMLFEGDQPPYPLLGTKRLFTWFRKVLSKVQSTGLLRMNVMVDSEGNAESVTVLASPHPDMSKLAAQIVMAEKYQPAVCAGKPCAMAVPYAINFSIH
ncbi:MAG: energy transducer TonB [Pseudomonadota bacterium]